MIIKVVWQPCQFSCFQKRFWLVIGTSIYYIAVFVILLFYKHPILMCLKVNIFVLEKFQGLERHFQRSLNGQFFKKMSHKGQWSAKNVSQIIWIWSISCMLDRTIFFAVLLITCQLLNQGVIMRYLLVDVKNEVNIFVLPVSYWGVSQKLVCCSFLVHWIASIGPWKYFFGSEHETFEKYGFPLNKFNPKWSLT